MNLTIKNGMVAYKMEAGKDVVSAEMPVEKAEKMLATGTKRASNRFPGFPVCVNNRYYLAAESGKAKTRRQVKSDV